MEIKRIAVLMTVFNRKELTIRCLNNLKNAISRTSGLIYDTYILDDASTDGTSEMIKVLYPEVNLITSKGNLFWCRGMIEAWKAASQKQYDYFLMLNNDSFIFEDGLVTVLSCSSRTSDNSIISGAFRSEFSNKATYGGRLKGEKVNLAPNGDLQKIVWLNGNFVLVPKKVFDKIGMLDSVFHHAIGDYDYGLRAIQNGFEVFLTDKYVGTCEEHDKIQDCYDENIPFLKRIKKFYSPLGDNPFQRFIFLNRHQSFIKGMLAFGFTHFCVLNPRFVKWCEKKRLARSK